MTDKEIKAALLDIRQEIEKETVSQAELLFLQEHHDEIKKLGDIVLAEWAGIPEDEWQNREEEE